VADFRQFHQYRAAAAADVLSRGAYRQLPVASVPLIVSVPSGNFGNLTAESSPSASACQWQDTWPQQTQRRSAGISADGEFHPRAAQATYSNAMDVGNPNNFPRLLDLCRNRLEYVQKEIWGHGATDEETLAGMKMLHDRFGYIADPHTAVGVLGWEAYKLEHAEPAQGLVLATAHPSKFAEVVMKAIGIAPPLPDRLAAYLKRDKLSLPISSSYDEFKQFLLTQ